MGQKVKRIGVFLIVSYYRLNGKGGKGGEGEEKYRIYSFGRNGVLKFSPLFSGFCKIS
jgi:hypothetical protein